MLIQKSRALGQTTASKSLREAKDKLGHVGLLGSRERLVTEPPKIAALLLRPPMLALTTAAAFSGQFSELAGLEKVVKAVRTVGTDANAAANRPVIPDQWSATITSKVNSTVPNVPSGTFVITQYYDYVNKLLRKDLSDGTTKMYDYKTMVDSGSAPWPPFPSPQGFKFRTDDIENTCCWLWLVTNNTGSPIPTAETMDQFQLEKNSVDEGSDARGEHWHSHKWFPV